jgi:predicted ester cyclase
MSPTGKEVEITNVSVCRIEGGKMAEEWPAPDRLVFRHEGFGSFDGSTISG